MSFVLMIGRERMKAVLLFIVILTVFPSPGFGEMYKWVDEKGTLHFADDLSKVPEKYRPGGYSRDYWVGQFRFYN